MWRSWKRGLPQQIHLGLVLVSTATPTFETLSWSYQSNKIDSGLYKLSPSDTPLCIRYARSSGLGDTSTIYSLGCAKTHEAISATSTVISGPGMMESVVAKVVLDGVQGKLHAIQPSTYSTVD